MIRLDLEPPKICRSAFFSPALSFQNGFRVKVGLTCEEEYLRALLTWLGRAPKVMDAVVSEEQTGARRCPVRASSQDCCVWHARLPLLLAFYFG